MYFICFIHSFLGTNGLDCADVPLNTKQTNKQTNKQERSEEKKSSWVDAQLELETDLDETMPVDVLELGLEPLGSVELNKRPTRRFKIALSWLCPPNLV